MRNQLEDIKQQAIQQGKEQLKKAAKESIKKVGQQIWSAIAPALPWIILALVILIIIVGCVDWDDVGVTSTSNTGIGEPTGWWWPIGSMETTTENGLLFASGAPALGKEVIYRMGKKGQAYGITKYSHPNNYAIDISPGETNKYYIISIGNGTVKSIGDGVEEGKSTANGGRGNYVEVDYGSIYVRYLHLYKGTIQVKVGDNVTYGQVIGKMGNSGNSDDPHLHIDIKVNEEFVDATEYLDPDNPRPRNEVEYTDIDTSLTEYLLNFGGKGKTYDIEGRKFYKSYDDGTGLLTVGLDVYMGGYKDGFSVSGYVSDTEEGPSKFVNNVYDYAINKFNSTGSCVYIEKELSDACAADIRDSKWQKVNELETSIGTTFSTQQKFALCAIYYRRC